MKADSELRAHVERIRKAIQDEGSHPPYHRRKLEQLRQEWPTLYTAITGLINEQPRHRKEPMTINHDDIRDLIVASDQASARADEARRALEKAVWEAREKHNPQTGEAWRVILPYSTVTKTVIPAIKTARGWVTDPAYDGGDDLTDIEDGYFPESTVIPLERLDEAPDTEGDTE